MNSVAATISSHKILRRAEIAKVLSELHRLSSRSVNTRQNLALFRLTCCCGLRVSEACGLRLRDVRTDLEQPYIRVPRSIAKGKKTTIVNGERRKVGNNATARNVPLTWDAGTLDDLRAWKRQREQQGAGANDYYLCSQAANAFGKPLDRRNARARFKKSCAVLGIDRSAEVTIHHGRHSFVSHALAGGRSLAEVRDAAGHGNVAMTSIYLHVTVEDDGAVGDLFEYKNNGNQQPRSTIDGTQENAQDGQRPATDAPGEIRDEQLPIGA